MAAIVDQLVQDIRYAVRTMSAQPLFAAMAALTLALGIGANAAIYSFMDAILGRALPVQNPESLVVLNWHAKVRPPVIHSSSGSQWHDPKTGLNGNMLPYGFYESIRESNPVFSGVFGFSGAGNLNVQYRSQADLARAQYVTGGFFGALGVPPAAGRLLDPSDDREGAPLAVTLSYGYAQRRFGDVARAVSETLSINGNSFVVSGVAAPEFFGVNPAGAQDIYLPQHSSILMDRIFSPTADTRAKYSDPHYYWLQMMARLRPGVTRAQAQAAMAPALQHFVDASIGGQAERVNPPALIVRDGAGGLDFLRRQYSQPLYVLMTLVALILAIACANVANLLLARAAGRRREMALRLSLGAGRWRVVRQLLTESLLLAFVGGALGIVFAKWGISGLTLLLANGQENFTLHAELNWHVLGLALALSVGTGALFGLAPALQSTRVDLVSSLKQTRAGDAASVRLHRRIHVSLSHVLAVCQIAISLLLLVAAGLFVRTLTNLNNVSLGFNRERMLLVTLNARQAGYQDDALMSFYATLQERFRHVPGVRATTFSNYAMVSNSVNTTDVRVAGQTAPNKGTDVLNVGADFFSTMQIPILLGREIGEPDTAGSKPVAVVNEVFARTYFGTDNPVGRHFQLSSRNGLDLEIVGVCRTARLVSLKDEIDPVTYTPYSANRRQTAGSMVYELRTVGDPMAVATAVRQVVRDADARIPINTIRTQEQNIDQTIGQERTFATLCTCFAVLAALIAFVGLYGMMAYRVARRTNEIGIRMALGAARRRLLWMVLREVLVMALVGLAIGLPVAFATTRFVRSFLFQMKPNDPLAVAAAVAALLAAAALAGYGPAWRASRIDPWTALRDE